MPLSFLTPEQQVSLSCDARSSVGREIANCNIVDAPELILTIGPPNLKANHYPFTEVESMIAAVASLGCRAVIGKRYEIVV